MALKSRMGFGRNFGPDPARESQSIQVVKPTLGRTEFVLAPLPPLRPVIATERKRSLVGDQLGLGDVQRPLRALDAATLVESLTSRFAIR